MARRDIQAGSAFVRLYVRRNAFQRGLDDAQKRLRAFGASMGAVGSTMARVGAGIVGVSATIATSLALSIRAAGDLLETTSKFDAVFGTSAEAARSWADDYRQAVGRARSETLESMSSFQGFYTGLGIGAKQAAEMSQEMHGLSVDFASFNNLTDAEGMQRFISALSGSGEVLDRFGVNIKQAALNQQLLTMGFPEAAKGATELQKVLARMAIIRDTMGRQGAIGDALTTSGSFNNQMKALRASIKDTSEDIGLALLPVVTPLVKTFLAGARAVGEWIRANKEAVVTISKVIVGALGLGAILTALGIAIIGTGAVLSGIATTLGVIASAIGIVLSPIGLLGLALLGGVAAWLKWSNSAKITVATIKGTIFSLVGIFKDVVGGMKDALMAGDLQLAGKIAMTGLKVAMLSIGESISSALGGVFGDTVGAIVSQLSSGDISGAWNTVVLAMGATWDKWASGIVTTMTGAAKRVVDVWAKMTTGIAQWLIKQSAAGGAMGKLTSAILGVDVSELTAELDPQVLIRNLESALKENKKRLADLESSDDLKLALKIKAEFEQAELSLDGIATLPGELAAQREKLQTDLAAAAGDPVAIQAIQARIAELDTSHIRIQLAAQREKLQTDLAAAAGDPVAVQAIQVQIAELDVRIQLAAQREKLETDLAAAAGDPVAVQAIQAQIVEVDVDQMQNQLAAQRQKLKDAMIAASEAGETGKMRVAGHRVDKLDDLSRQLETGEISPQEAQQALASQLQQQVDEKRRQLEQFDAKLREVDRLRESVTRTSQKIEDVGSGKRGPTTLEMGLDWAADDIDSTADRIRGHLDGIKTAADTAAQASGNALKKNVAGGAAEASDKLKQARADLEALRKQAKEAADKAAADRKKKVEEAAAEGPGEGRVAPAGNVAVTFSATALAAMGMGGGPQDRVAEAIRKGNAKAEQQREKLIETDEQVVAGLNNMGLGLRYAP